MIANEFGEAHRPIHRSALFAAGLVLFVLTLIVNIIARWFVARGDTAAAGRRFASDRRLRIGRPHVRAWRRRVSTVELARRSAPAGGARTRSCAARCWPATLIALVPLVPILYYLLYKGLSAVPSSGFFTSDPNGNFFGNPGGIRSAIFGTIEIVALATLIAVPLGIGVALYLTEYGRTRASRTSCATSST